LNSITEATTDLLSRIASAPNAQPESWEMHRDACVTKKGDRQLRSSYRLLSIAPLMARYTSSAFGRQVMPVLESFFGDHQHGFRKGRSCTSLLQIIESTIANARTEGSNLIVIQLDISKAFDRIHRGALMSFVQEIIQPQAPEAALFIKDMYTGDSVSLSHEAETAKVMLEAGIRQGDPMSPALFSAMIGHALSPVIQKWKRQGWGYKGITRNGEAYTVPILAYADDITLMATTQAQANGMLTDVSNALRGINLLIEPAKCSALWSRYTEGHETTAIHLGEGHIPVKPNMEVLGQLVSFQRNSEHSLRHRIEKTWQVAYANTTLIRSKHATREKSEDDGLNPDAMSPLRRRNVDVDSGTTRASPHGRKAVLQVVHEDPSTSQRRWRAGGNNTGRLDRMAVSHGQRPSHPHRHDAKK
jgi:hypothetical protein